MNPKLREELAVIFPLADALQMTFDVKDKLGGTRITGEAEFWMDVGAAKLLLHPKVMASVVEKEGAGVLVKVQKRLWVYLTYYKVRDYLHLFILDANTLGLKEGNSIAYGLGSLGSMEDKFKDGIVRKYGRCREDVIWKPIVNVDPVDQGRSELPQEEPRVAGTPV